MSLLIRNRKQTRMQKACNYVSQPYYNIQCSQISLFRGLDDRFLRPFCWWPNHITYFKEKSKSNRTTLLISLQKNDGPTIIYITRLFHTFIILLLCDMVIHWWFTFYPTSDHSELERRWTVPNQPSWHNNVQNDFLFLTLIVLSFIRTYFFISNFLH